MRAKDLRESLTRELLKKGADTEIYKGLIEDYVWFWQQFKAMKADIGKRGRTYEALSSTGKTYEKNNPAVKDALMYSKQMVSILNAMGLSTDKVLTGSGGDSDGDLG